MWLSSAMAARWSSRALEGVGLKRDEDKMGTTPGGLASRGKKEHP